MNGYTRKKLYRKIVSRDGEYCRCCGTLSSERPLVLDHKNNDNKQNNLENLQLLCRKCNFLKNQRPVYLSVCEKIEISGDSELETSRKKKPQFKKYVIQRINKELRITWDELMYYGAELLDVSPMTTNRYLKTLTSSSGILQTKFPGDSIFVEYKSELPDA